MVNELVAAGRREVHGDFADSEGRFSHARKDYRRRAKRSAWSDCASLMMQRILEGIRLPRQLARRRQSPIWRRPWPKPHRPNAKHQPRPELAAARSIGSWST